MKKLKLIALITLIFSSIITSAHAMGKTKKEPLSAGSFVEEHQSGKRFLQAHQQDSRAIIAGGPGAFFIDLSFEAKDRMNSLIQILSVNPEIGVNYPLKALFNEANFDALGTGQFVGFNYLEAKRTRRLIVNKDLDSSADIDGFIRFDAVSEEGVLEGTFEFKSKAILNRISFQKGPLKPKSSKFNVSKGKFIIQLVLDSSFRVQDPKLHLESKKLSEIFADYDLKGTRAELIDLKARAEKLRIKPSL